MTVRRSPPPADPAPPAGASDPRAWTAAAAGRPEDWRRVLPAPLVEELRAIVPRGISGEAAITRLTLPDEHRAAWEETAGEVLAVLERGRGFLILEGLDDGSRPAAETTALYWLLGRALGRPLAQNVQGTLLYDVRDTGRDVGAGARFSVTNADSSFHTDNSFGAEVLDYVGLLCLRTARSGGVNHLVSGCAARELLRAERPGCLDILMQPFHVDRRGGTRPGEAPTVRMPVIEQREGGPLYRYLRYWIEAGHERAGEPLAPAQREALDCLDAVLARPDLRVEFSLRPGDALLVNNRWILHRRTAFTDWPEPGRKRHYVRLWLQAGK